MASDGRLVIVSNRVALPRQNSVAAGGLAVGVLGALREHGGVWFGWSGELTAGEASDPEIISRGNIDYATISLNDADFERYYNGYSNRVLWPVCHYLLDFIQYDSADFEAYKRVNQLFARKLATLIKPNDIVWVHDYHLIPLAAELRQAGFDNRIGFFLHVPFPAYEALRAAPGHDYLLRALCAYDVLGFHTPHDLAAFESCVREPVIGGTLLGEGRVRISGGELIADVFPIGIDVDELQGLATEADSLRQVSSMVRSLAGRDLIIGVDRLDYSKGLMQRMLSYERLLEKYPNTQRSVTLMQIAPPTRAGVRAYDEIRRELEQVSGRINGRFADSDWVPIRYLNKGVARKPLMGFFRNATVGLVTPVRDGMNLVAKEFVAAQDTANPGVLVLSSLAGAACELTDAIIVNPHDRDDVADGIASAVTMSLAERRERHSAMLEVLRRNDIHAWRRRFIEALATKQASP